MLLSTLSSSWIQHAPALGAVGWSATEFSQFIASNAIPLEYERHMFVGILNTLFYLIASLFTPETALSVTPAQLRAQFSMVLLDASMLCTPCQLDQTELIGLPAYVALFNSAILTTWKLLTHLQNAMRSMVQFLHDSEMRNGNKTILSECLIHLAVEGLDALEIVGSTRFASSFIELLNDMSTAGSSQQLSVVYKGQMIMLRLLCHSNDSIRKATYVKLQQLVQEAIDVNIVANPTKAINGLGFLLRDEVLCELIEFGLRDQCVVIRNSAELILTGLLNGYAILPQTTWKTLRRLILMQATSPEPLCGTVRPLSICLAPHARVPQNQNERDKLGALSLDWCLGFMTELGRRAWDIEDQALNYCPSESDIFDETSDQIVVSVCRLLMSPVAEVRLRAATVLCNHLQHFYDRFTGAESTHRISHCDSVRLIEGASASSESRSAPLGNSGQTSTMPVPLPADRYDSEHITSTPMLQTQTPKFNAATADKLSNCFISIVCDSSGSIPAPPLLDQDNVPIQDLNQEVDEDQLTALLQVMQLFTDSDSDLGVRRAAGEQVAILIRHPLLLSSWFSNGGLEASCDLVTSATRNVMLLAAQSESPEMFQSPSISDLPISSVLLPILARTLRYAVIWNAPARSSLFRRRDFVLHLIYLLLAHPDVGGLHANLIDLVTLLVFSPVIQSSEESPVCVPVGVATGFRLPFICPTYSFRLLWQNPESGTFKQLTDLLTVSVDASNDETFVLEALIRRSVRCSWSIACHGSANKLIQHCLAVLGAFPSVEKVDPVMLDQKFKWVRDFSPLSSNLALATSDLALLLVTHPVSSLLLSLTAVQQASSHANLVRALGMLLRSVHAHQLQDDTRIISKDLTNPEEHQQNSVCWWLRAHLDRFLRTLPACSADFHLLSSLLETIDEIALRSTIPSVIALGSNAQLCQWLQSVLVDNAGPLAYYLLQSGAGIGETDSRRLASAKRRLIYHQLPRLLSDLTARLSAIGFNTVQQTLLSSCGSLESSNSTSEVARIEFLGLCLQWSYNALVSFAQNPFSDLVHLRLVLGVLCNVTASNLWPIEFNQSWAWRLFDVSTSVLAQFDAGRDEPCQSFMGAGTLKLFLTLNVHLLAIFATYPQLFGLHCSDSERLMVLDGSDSPFAQTMPNSEWAKNEWLLRCLVYRSPELRGLALCILAQLCRIPKWAKCFSSCRISLETQTLLSTHKRYIPQFGGKLWNLAFSCLLDANESCAIRAQAVHLLLNLTALPMNPRESGIFLPPAVDRPSQTDVRREPEAPADMHIANVAQPSTRSASGSTSRNRTEEDNELGDASVESQSSESTASTSDRMPAGDRPTVTITNTGDEDSNALDLRVLFRSDLESNEMRENFAELLRFLQPLFNDLFATSETLGDQLESLSNGSTPVIVGRGEQVENLDPSLSDQGVLLLHMSTVPRSSLLPCYFDSNGGFYLSGVSGLQQLLISLNVLDYLRRLLTAYLPQPLLDPTRWNSLTSSGSLNSTEFPDSVERDRQACGRAAEQFFRPNLDSTTQRSGVPNDNPVCSTTKLLCTPLLASVVCQLLVNLLHHLPKFVPAELMRLRVHSLLMNIVDPNLLEAIVSGFESFRKKHNAFASRWCAQNTWLLTHKHLVHCFANCLQVLRCQAAMHLATRSLLKSDVLFLTRLIRSLKHSYQLDIWAPVWREIFALLTCLMVVPDPSGTVHQDLRLILRPLSTRVDSWLEILLAMVNRAELQLGSPQSEQLNSRNPSHVYCKQARSALNFFIVALSHHRPLSENPVVEAIDLLHQVQTTQQKEKCKPNGSSSPAQEPPKSDIVTRLTRRFMVLVSSSSVLTDKAANREHSVYGIAYRRALRSALQTLLGCCRSAKMVAVADGLLEELVVGTQLLQAKLDLFGLTMSVEASLNEPPSARTNKTNQPPERKKQQASKQWNLLISELIAQCEIMHNLVYVCPDARKRAIEAGLPQLAHRLWPLALQDVRVLHALLALLTNLSADCPSAASVLAANTAVSRAHPVACFFPMNQNDPPAASRSGGSTRPRSIVGTSSGRSSPAYVMVDAPGAPSTTQSLVHYVCRLFGPLDNSPGSLDYGFCIPSAGRMNSSGSTRMQSAQSSLYSSPEVRFEQEVTTRYIFQLLSNLVWAPEARNALLKTKLLSRFPELDARTLMKSRRGQFLLSLWIQLLTSLSFTKQGQQMLFTQPRMSHSLTACVNYSKPGDIREAALLTLRNLCTNSTFKSRLLTGDMHVLDCLRDLILNELGSPNQSENLLAVALSSIEALIYGNQKVRTLIRSSGFLRHLTQLWTSCQKTSKLDTLVFKIEHVMNLLQN